MSSSSPRTQLTRRSALGIALGLGVSGASYGLLRASQDEQPRGAATPVVSEEPADLPPLQPDKLTFQRDDNAGLTIVVDEQGQQIATFTDGARTVTMAGSERLFAEPATTSASVRTGTRVYLAPRLWTTAESSIAWARPWLARMRAQDPPDIFEIAFEYVQGAREMVDSKGIRYAGDAAFGPEGGPGEPRLEASDFYDYLGVPWTFPDGVRKEPEKKRYGAADCSGYMRLVLGYRLGLPMLSGNTPGPGLPRRAYAMAGFGPGRLIIPERDERPEDLSGLRQGDLVFFLTDRYPGIDHCGIFLGVDSDSKRRFISSRGAANGPTMGDVSGTSVLDGTGMFTRGFRAARRI